MKLKPNVYSCKHVSFQQHSLTVLGLSHSRSVSGWNGHTQPKAGCHWTVFGQCERHVKLSSKMHHVSQTTPSNSFIHRTETADISQF